MLLVKYVGPDYGLHDGTLALVAIGAFLGHLFPVFFKFKGGKGVATALGVLLGISGWLGLLVLLTWLAVALTTRYSSLSALVAAVLAPVYYVLLGGSLWNYDQSVLLAVIAMSALLLWRHAENIGRLLGARKAKSAAKKTKPLLSPSRSARKSAAVKPRTVLHPRKARHVRAFLCPSVCCIACAACLRTSSEAINQ